MFTCKKKTHAIRYIPVHVCDMDCQQKSCIWVSNGSDCPSNLPRISLIMLPIILAPDSRLEGLSKNWVQSNPTVHGIFQTLTHDHPFPS